MFSLFFCSRSGICAFIEQALAPKPSAKPEGGAKQFDVAGASDSDSDDPVLSSKPLRERLSQSGDLELDSVD